MTVCKFWQNGFCRNGSNCRFEHPPKNQPTQSTNRFGALAPSANMSNNQQLPYGLSAEVIQRDLQNELPPWILSCYGPGKDAPEQLFGGYPRELSFEEVRLHYQQGAASGNPEGALNEIQGLYQNANQQIQHTITNLNSAIQFVVDAGNKHPNRADICRASMPEGGTTGEFAKDKPASTNAFGSTNNAFQNNAPSSNPFGAPAAGGGAFGQPSTMGQKPSPFGTPAFGQPAHSTATSAFGKPALTSAFGQPATLGGTSASGQPVQASSAFGQGATLGAKPNPFGTPAFGQPAQPSGGSVFGQPSQAGGGSAFGQPSQQTSTSAFGQPSQSGGTSAFGQPAQQTSAFGQPAALGQKPNPFGAPTGASPFGAPAQQPPASNPFGSPAQTTPAANPFGQPTQTTPAPTGFGQPTQTTPAPTGFGQPAQTTPASTGFGQPAPSSAPATNPFGQPPAAASTNAFGQPQTTAPATNPFGAPATTSAPTNPFGQPPATTTTAFGAPQTTQPASTSVFGGGGGGGGGFGSVPPPATGAPAATPQGAQGQGPYGPGATRQHPDITQYSTKGPDNRLRMFKGRPVTYQVLKRDDKEVPVIRNNDGSVTKIWFPDGAPIYTADTEASDPNAYNDPQVQQQWNSFMQTRTFAGGFMPEVPPKREFCAWDF